MSRFTSYQVHHYRKAFDRYVDTEDSRLTANALYHLLLLFGPELPVEEVKQLVYEYDYNCVGTIEFEDFLELLSDYETRIKEEKDAIKDAFQHFIQKAKESGLGREAFIQILKTGDTGFTDAEINQVVADYFPDGEELITDTEFVEKDTTTKWIPADPPLESYKKLMRTQKKMKGDGNVVIDIDEDDGEEVEIEDEKDNLTRHLIVHIHRAMNLDPYCRTKVRRGKGIQYNSIDPIVSVTCIGETKETKALIGDSSPEWQEDLRFEIEFPKVSNMFELSQWIQSQRLQFNLYDYVTDGTVPHLEWVATGSISLSTALEATGTQKHIILTMRSPSLPPATVSVEELAILLEVSLRVDDDGVMELLQPMEDYFVQIYQKKLMVDLSCGLQAKQAAFRRKLSNIFRTASGTVDQKTEEKDPSRSAANLPNFVAADHEGRQSGSHEHTQQTSLSVNARGNAPTPLWKHFITFHEDFRKKFKRRPFPVIGLDEYNIFRCLVTFIRPFDVPVDLKDPKKLAEMIASFPYARQIPSIPPQQRILQCSSPALYPLKESLTELEGSILMCNMFLGLGLDAYVCVGTALEQRRYWVIVLEKASDKTHAIESLTQAVGVPVASPAALHPTGLSAPAAMNLPATPMLRSYESALRVGVENEYQDVQPRPDSELESRPNTAGLLEWELSKFSRLQEKTRKKDYRALHWNVTNGHVWSGDTPGCPFDRVDGVFNHKNIWLNVQRSNMLYRCHWNLDNSADWASFLTPQVVEDCGPIECWYSERSIGQYPFLQGVVTDITPKSLVADLMQNIQAYRRNYLYISETFFHRRISRFLQESIHQLQEFEHHGKSTYQKTSEEGILEILPDHIGWHGRIIRLMYRNMDQLMQQLVWTGILDCTVPHSVYALAAFLQRHHFGFSTVWIHIGYLFNLHDPRNIGL